MSSLGQLPDLLIVLIYILIYIEHVFDTTRSLRQKAEGWQLGAYRSPPFVPSLPWVRSLSQATGTGLRNRSIPNQVAQMGAKIR